MLCVRWCALLIVASLTLVPGLASGSGTCQRAVPGELMDGNGCGPADSAVGDVCCVDEDCFFDGCRCETDDTTPPGVAPPSAPPRACDDFFDVNMHCPAHQLNRLVPASCDEGVRCHEVFVSWYQRCWFSNEVQTTLEAIPGSRDQLTEFYEMCNGGGAGDGSSSSPMPNGSGGGKQPERAGDTCGDLASRVDSLNGECCDEANEDCSSGQPATCNAGCAAVLLPFFTDCSEAR